MDTPSAAYPISRHFHAPDFDSIFTLPAATAIGLGPNQSTELFAPLGKRAVITDIIIEKPDPGVGVLSICEYLPPQGGAAPLFRIRYSFRLDQTFTCLNFSTGLRLGEEPMAFRAIALLNSSTAVQLTPRANGFWV